MTSKQIARIIIQFIFEQICRYYFLLIWNKIYHKAKKILLVIGYSICISFGVLICLPIMSFIIANDLLNMKK